MNNSNSNSNSSNSSNFSNKRKNVNKKISDCLQKCELFQNKNSKISTQDILEGKVPHFQRLGIKKRLIKEGLKKYQCEMCGLIEWHGIKIGLELDHINGNCYDHRLENLRLLCPNCHATTSTYRGKNKKPA